MRQDQSFPAQVELLLYEKSVRLWRLISENETKCSNLEQKRPTKSQEAAGVRIVLLSPLSGGTCTLLATRTDLPKPFSKVLGLLFSTKKLLPELRL